VKPLQRHGIDVLEIKKDNHVVESVTKEESSYFSGGDVSGLVEEVKELLLDNTSEGVLGIVRIAFREGIKSRFTDGSREFEVEIKDDDFMSA
jgi:hypothetical protein